MSGLLERIVRRRRTAAELRSAAAGIPAEFAQVPYEPTANGADNGAHANGWGGANGREPGEPALNVAAPRAPALAEAEETSPAEAATAPPSDPVATPPTDAPTAVVAETAQMPVADPETAETPVADPETAQIHGAEPETAVTTDDPQTAVTTEMPAPIADVPGALVADTPDELGADTADVPAADVPDAPTAPEPGLRERGRIRRRARYLRRLREVQLRDIGGLSLELHRFDRRRDDLVQQKVVAAAETDLELRALERALDERQTIGQLREAGIGGACANCGAVHGSADRFCAFCGDELRARPPAPDAGSAA
jgi:hypothetical protein